MSSILWALLLPLLTSACLCPSCGCGGGGGGYGGGSYYGGGGGGYGYGQPYNTFFNQPIPAGPGVEVRPGYAQPQRVPFYGQQAQPQYLPPLQAPPQLPLQSPGYVQPQSLPAPSNPRVVAPRLNTGYSLPVQNGWQPARQVEPLRSRAITSATSAPYTGTTRIVPAKKAGKNSDYEYYYVYYDENGKKTGTGTAKPKLHDGSIQSRSTAAPQNTIDEYDFDDAKDVGGEITTIATLAPVNEPVTISLPSITPAAVAIPMFDEPHGEVHAVEEETTAATPSEAPESSIRTTAPTSAAGESADPIYDDIDAGKKETISTEAATTEEATTESTVQEETVTFETASPPTTEATTAEVVSVASSTETLPGKEEPKMYEYEEYEVEEIQLVNENGVTETVTRIITTTKAPKRQV